MHSDKIKNLTCARMQMCCYINAAVLHICCAIQYVRLSEMKKKTNRVLQWKLYAVISMQQRHRFPIVCSPTGDNTFCFKPYTTTNYVKVKSCQPIKSLVYRYCATTINILNFSIYGFCLNATRFCTTKNAWKNQNYLKGAHFRSPNGFSIVQ